MINTIKTRLINNYPIILILGFYTILSLFIFRGILQPGFVGNGDNILIEYPDLALYRYSYIIDFYEHAGKLNVELARYPMIIFFSFIGTIFSPGISNRLFIILGSTIGFYTMFFFTKKILKNNIPAFLAGLFFGINSWVISRILAGHISLLIAYGLIPLFLIFLFEAVGFYDGFTSVNKLRTKIKPIILSAITLTIISSAVMFDGLIITILITFILIIFWLAYIVFSFSGSIRPSVLFDTINLKKQILIHIIVSAALIITITILLSLYWIIPVGIYALTSSATSTSQTVLPWLHSRAVLENLLTLKGYWWPQFTDMIYASDSMILNRIYLVLSWIPFLALLNTIPRLRESKEKLAALSLLSVFTIGLLLSLGANLFGSYYQYFTLFGVFRDPEKFSALIALTYPFFIAIFANKTIHFINEKKPFLKTKYIKIKTVTIPRKKFYSIIIILIFTASHLLVVWPALTGNFRNSYDSLEMPESYPIVNNWLEEQEGDFKVLWLPADDYIKFDWSKDRSMGEPMRYLSGKQTVQTVDPARDVTPWTSLSIMQINHFLERNETKNIGKILGPMNIKYIIFRSDVVSPSFPNMFSSLMQQEDLLLKFSKEPLYIFENNHYLPIIRPTTNNIIVADAAKGLLKLSHLAEDFSDISYTYLEHMGISNENIEKRLNNSDAFFYSIHNLLDLQLVATPERYRIEPHQYASTLSDQSSFNWVQTVFEKETRGSLYYGTGTASTWSGTAQLHLPIQIETSEHHDIWVRLFGGIENYDISINDNKLLPQTIPTHSGFNWVKYATMKLDKKEYALTITAKHESYLHIVDEIIILPKQTFLRQQIEIGNMLAEKKIFVFIEGEELKAEKESRYLNEMIFSQKQALYINISATTQDNTQLIVPNKDRYIIGFLGGSTHLESSPTISLTNDQFEITMPLIMGSSLQWYYTKPFEIGKGGYTLTINGTQTTIDALVLFRETDKNFWNQKPNEQIQYQIMNPANIQIKTNNYQTIISSFSFDQYWTATDDNNKPVSLQLCNAFNICMMTDDNTINVNLNYSLQTSAYIGIIISIITITAITILYFWKYIPKPKEIRVFLNRQQQT